MTAKQKKQKKKETPFESLVSWIKTIIGAIIVVMFLNGALIASFVVPTGSMEKTVLPGDFLFVNKFMYGPTTPQIIPFANIPLPYIKFPGPKDPEVNDVIVFIFPGGRDEVEATEFQYYLKRCVAAAGDTLELKNKAIYVNGKLMVDPAESVKNNKEADDYERALTFPRYSGFTSDDYGPIRIPKKGDVIELNPKNIAKWDTFIIREGNEDATSDGKNVYINGNQVDSYTVQRNYCFAVGDNRDNSFDSRFWGFVPYDNVVGTPLLVYWSWPVEDNFGNQTSLMEKIKNVRWGRIGKVIK
jgi:signal peptidase I